MKYEFLGIVFRSELHMMWFELTVGVLVLATIILCGFLFFKSYEFPIFIFGSLGVAFLCVSITSVGMTRFGTVNGENWSVDCIWYNALLSVIYFSEAWACAAAYNRNERKPHAK